MATFHSTRRALCSLALAWATLGLLSPTEAKQTKDTTPAKSSTKASTKASAKSGSKPAESNNTKPASNARRGAAQPYVAANVAELTTERTMTGAILRLIQVDANRGKASEAGDTPLLVLELFEPRAMALLDQLQLKGQLATQEGRMVDLQRHAGVRVERLEVNGEAVEFVLEYSPVRSKAFWVFCSVSLADETLGAPLCHTDSELTVDPASLNP